MSVKRMSEDNEITHCKRNTDDYSVVLNSTEFLQEG